MLSLFDSYVTSSEMVYSNELNVNIVDGYHRGYVYESLTMTSAKAWHLLRYPRIYASFYVHRMEHDRALTNLQCIEC